MRNLARKQEPRQDIVQELGTVVRRSGDVFAVRTDGGGDMEARRATSCLLDPAVGDRALLVVTPAGESYVLAVLDREEGAPGTITADGDLDIRLRSGRLGVAAQEGVSVVSGKDLSVISGGLSVRAVAADVAMESFTFLSAVVRAELTKAKVFAGSLETIAERLTERVKRSYRFVEESDHLRAERIDHVAKGTMNLHGANTLITAEALVKVDGEQIHLG